MAVPFQSYSFVTISVIKTRQYSVKSLRYEIREYIMLKDEHALC